MRAVSAPLARQLSTLMLSQKCFTFAICTNLFDPERKPLRKATGVRSAQIKPAVKIIENREREEENMRLETWWTIQGAFPARALFRQSPVHR